MKYQWLGQNGFVFYTKNKTIIVDPYLSDSCKKHRYTPIKREIFTIVPDIIVCTHDHLDHTDHESLEHFLRREKKIEFISPYSSFNSVREYGYNQHNYVMMSPHTEWTSGDVKFTAVKAFHSDLYALGFIIEAEGRKIYITGDTLYNTEIFADLPDGIDVMFVCINGVGNNMNIEDAKRFAQKVSPKKVIPVHFGMFDRIDASAFDLENAEVPEPYVIKEI